jgi:hypothetical protein
MVAKGHPAKNEVIPVSLPDGLPLPRRRWAFATVVLGVTLAVLDGSVANVALPTIAGEFQASRRCRSGSSTPTNSRW